MVFAPLRCPKFFRFPFALFVGCSFCLFCSWLSKMKIEEVSKSAIPFIIAMLICLLLIAYIPDISMLLVRVLA